MTTWWIFLILEKELLVVFYGAQWFLFDISISLVSFQIHKINRLDKTPNSTKSTANKLF